MTGGRNGYGAKLANIFSSKFVVETCDGKRRRRYKQAFSANMTKKGEPIMTCAQLLACCAARLLAALSSPGGIGSGPMLGGTGPLHGCRPGVAAPAC